MRELGQRLWDESEAVYHRRLLDALPQGAQPLLDVGCDDGAWTDSVRRKLGIAPAMVAGIEIVDERRELALARGFDVKAADLEQRWPFPDGAFGIVHANQVIEHVKRLDHFVGEVRRVLAPGGYAVICTENLASWHNVVALALGLQPFSAANISMTGALGNPFALHAGDTVDQSESWQHIHVVTLTALRQLFQAHGFCVEEEFAAGYYPFFGRVGRSLARRDPRHAHFIGLRARTAPLVSN